MNQELDDLLCSRYPKIFARRQAKDSTMHYGFCCGDGWFNLIDGLCTSLQFMTDERGAASACCHAGQGKVRAASLLYDLW